MASSGLTRKNNSSLKLVIGYDFIPSFGLFALSNILKVVEMFTHKAGYNHDLSEHQATHARRRYHLIGNRLGQPVNRNIFLIHYARADPQDVVDASTIFINPPLLSSLETRRNFKKSGQLVRREFVLIDQPNYPTINLPAPPLGSNTGYPGNMPRNHNINYPQQQPTGMHQASMAQVGVGPPPAKRQRQAPPSFTHGPNASIAAAAMASEALADEDEDVSRGDYFDQVTDREISANRYSLFHDWMEEIIGSPTPTSQIIPVDLGLGRKGPLEEATKDFVEAPVTGSSQTSSGRSTSESSGVLQNAIQMFRSLEETSAKMDQQMYNTMKAHGIPKPERFIVGMAKRHAKIIPDRYVGKMREGRVEKLKECVRQFNEAQDREIEENQMAFEAAMAEMRERRKIIDDEKKLRRPIPTSAEVGGKWWIMEYPDGDPHNAPGSISIHDTKTEGELLDEWSDKLGKKVVVLNDVTLVQKGGLDEEPPTDPNEGGIPSMDGTVDDDINMSGLPSSKASRAGSQGDWVMLNDKHNEQPQNGNGQTTFTANHTFPDLDAFTHNATMPDAMSSADTTAANVVATNFTPGALPTTTGFDTTAFNTPDAFANIDTAGEALAGYGDHDETMGLDEHGMEHSSFNDAFHDGAM